MLWKIFPAKSLCSWLKLRLVESRGSGAARELVSGQRGCRTLLPGLIKCSLGRGETLEGQQEWGSSSSATPIPSQASKRLGQRRMKLKHIFLCFPKLPELPNVLVTVCFRSLCQEVSGPLLSDTGSPLSSITCRRSSLDRVCL